ncbi:MAG: Flp pilus assembly complex ATPase component TadA, partial [Planctomycetes bacterium]|nr:Flp pilus assembly complex ATPase component TadA [Planctomycetota bacterium]
MAPFNRRVKNVLLKQSLLPSERVEEAFTEADAEGVAMTKILVEKNLLDERTLLGAIALDLGVPPIDLDKVSIDASVLEVIPQETAEVHCVLPVSRIGNILTLAVADSSDVIKLDNLRIVTGCDIRAVLSTEGTIKKGIQKAYNRSTQEMEQLIDEIGKEDVEVSEEKVTSDEDFDVPVTGEVGDKAPAVLLVKYLIQKAIDEGASDIHIEPMDKHVRVRYRRDGVLREAKTFQRQMLGSVVSRIKVMASLDIAERRKPQDGKFRVKVAGRLIDFRVSVLPLIHGEKIVLRILDTSKLALRLDTLGFEPKALTDFATAIRAPYGMILVTGPTGSGKSTTLYSGLQDVMTGSENITTVEDPVEYQL